jgi:glycosyltransferase involved in cell wall biosynthesis
MSKKHLRILGIRGLPAGHGGFETFAAELAPYLVEQGWRVTVYCQEQGSSPSYEDSWRGINLVHIPVRGDNAVSTILFDWHATRHAAAAGELCLTLGYNTAIFSALLRWKHIPNLMNMDGIEWTRAKWGLWATLWLAFNERAGCLLADHLIADHPEIKAHLADITHADKITTIAYGAPQLIDLPAAPVEALGLMPGRFITVIARPEPENSLLDIVEAFSAKARGVQLVVLGNYSDAIEYHRKVKAAASAEVRFVGAIYEVATVQALRYHSLAYIHGHQVGGSNPSLIEAMGAGNAVIAHDNRFNRWVAGAGALYFEGSAQLGLILDELLTDAPRLAAMRAESAARAQAEFTWERILGAYAGLLEKYLEKVPSSERGKTIPTRGHSGQS